MSAEEKVLYEQIKNHMENYQKEISPKLPIQIERHLYLDKYSLSFDEGFCTYTWRINFEDPDEDMINFYTEGINSFINSAWDSASTQEELQLLAILKKINFTQQNKIYDIKGNLLSEFEIRPGDLVELVNE